VKVIAVALLVSSILIGGASACIQGADRVWYEGGEYSLHGTPLEQFFLLHPEVTRPEMPSTALSRGYVATFEIRNDSLFLREVGVECEYKEIDDSLRYHCESGMADFFPGESEVFCNWSTGVLGIAYGMEVNDWVHYYSVGFSGFVSTSVHYVLIEVNQGLVTDRRQLNLKTLNDLLENQYDAFRGTPAYHLVVDSLLKIHSTCESVENTIKDDIFDFTSQFLFEGEER